jgi:hypothetical protein
LTIDSIEMLEKRLSLSALTAAMISTTTAGNPGQDDRDDPLPEPEPDPPPYPGDDRPIGGPATPDRSVREQSPIAPGISLLELLGRHVPGPEDGVGRVVESPVLVQEPPLCLHLTEQRRSRIGRQDVKCGALEPGRLDPGDGPLEDIAAVMVEAQHEAAIDLDTVVMKDRHAPGVVIRTRGLLVGGDQVFAGERLEADELSLDVNSC